MPESYTQSQTDKSRQASDLTLDQVLTYDVYDKNDEHIANVSAVWADHTGQAAFLGVKTTWLLGRTHVIPAYAAEVNHAEKKIRVPYDKETIEKAPSFDPEAELDMNREREVFSYYRTRGPQLPEFQEEGRREAPRPSPQRPAGREEATTMRLHEEQLNVGKREVEMGGVRLRKIIRTETVQQPVELKREDIEIERVPASERQPAGKAFEGEQDIFIPLRREEPVVEKEARVREEVRARKGVETERQTISGEVRREDVEIEDQRREDERERGH